MAKYQNAAISSSSIGSVSTTSSTTQLSGNVGTSSTGIANTVSGPSAAIIAVSVVVSVTVVGIAAAGMWFYKKKGFGWARILIAHRILVDDDNNLDPESLDDDTLPQRSIN